MILKELFEKYQQARFRALDPSEREAWANMEKPLGQFVAGMLTDSVLDTYIAGRDQKEVHEELILLARILLWARGVGLIQPVFRVPTLVSVAAGLEEPK